LVVPPLALLACEGHGDSDVSASHGSFGRLWAWGDRGHAGAPRPAARSNAESSGGTVRVSTYRMPPETSELRALAETAFRSLNSGDIDGFLASSRTMSSSPR
jgi:hypothetical protein